GHYSQHNTNYWKGVKYLGIGPSSHSYNGETRQWNIANNAKYIQSLISGMIPAEKEILSESNRLNEYIMTSLRTMWGLELSKLNAIAASASDILLKSASDSFEREWLRQENQIVYLTQKGKLYADHIASELFF
ncbi:MAG: radical SAM family heme chaperone HemW, partial [Mucilaginibacter sp.]